MVRMNNRTVASLTSQYIYGSPLFGGLYSLSLVRSSLRSSFFSSLWDISHLNVRFSQFSNYLSAPIVFSRSTIIYNQAYSSPVSPSGSSDCTISYSTFQNCSSSSNGGAIYYLVSSSTSSTLSISYSTFTNCYSSTNGGALFSDAYYFYFYGNMASNCSCGNTGTFVDHDQETRNTCPTQLNSTSAYSCSPLTSNSVISAGEGNQTLNSVNISSCQSSNRAVTLNLWTYQSLTVLYSIIYNNVGPSTVYLRGSTLCNSYYMSFVNNSNAGSGTNGVVQVGLGHAYIYHSNFCSNDGQQTGLYSSTTYASYINCIFSAAEVDSTYVDYQSCKFSQGSSCHIISKTSSFSSVPIRQGYNHFLASVILLILD